MSEPVRLIGIDRAEITDLDSWFDHAPPEGGKSQWVDGYSAKEQAKAWLRPGRPAVPMEIEYALGLLGLSDVTQWTGYPEHRTKFDTYGRGAYGRRHHDMLLLLGDPEKPLAVVGIEAKACEAYHGRVSESVVTAPPTKLPQRCNSLARALFGRDVCDADAQVVTDDALGNHGYQLWTASIGTITEAQTRGLSDAVFLVQQFVPGPPGPVIGDVRDWTKKLADNAAKLHEFQLALGPEPVTHETAFIRAGTRLHIAATCSHVADPNADR